VVKNNQPLLYARIKALPWQQVPSGSVTRDAGHGRLETRTLKTAHVKGLDFPGARQAIKITRWRQDTATGKTSRETVYAITSLTSAQATPHDLARLVREHWTIEAHHHVRSPGVPSLLRDVALECPTESFCNTSRECGACCRRCSEARPARTCNKCNTLRGDGEKLIKDLPVRTATMS